MICTAENTQTQGLVTSLHGTSEGKLLEDERLAVVWGAIIVGGQ